MAYSGVRGTHEKVCSLLFGSVWLLVWMAALEFRNQLQVLHDTGDVGELAHIDRLAISVVDHGGQKCIRQSDDVAQAVLAFSGLNLLLERSEAANDDPLGPRLPLVGSKARANLVEHS